MLTLLPDPIPVQVTRHLCPFCRRGRSTRGAAAKHIAHCWQNPDLRGCKTCENFKTPATKKVGTEQPVATCKAGFNLKPGLVTQCKRWKPKASDVAQ